MSIVIPICVGIRCVLSDQLQLRQIDKKSKSGCGAGFSCVLFEGEERGTMTTTFIVVSIVHSLRHLSSHQSRCKYGTHTIWLICLNVALTINTVNVGKNDTDCANRLYVVCESFQLDAPYSYFYSVELFAWVSAACHRTNTETDTHPHSKIKRQWETIWI